VTGSVTITQTVVLSISAAQYTGNIKTLMETAYGIGLGIYEQTNNVWAWATGCSVTSSAARRSARVTFVATVSATKSASAQSSASTLNAATLNNHVTAAKAALGSAYSGITVSVTGVETPTVAAGGSGTTATTGGTGTTSGAGKATTLSLAGLAAVFLALRH
jgi:hypothetical protein